MKTESIRKLVFGHCPCAVISRLNQNGIVKVTIEEIEAFLNAMKESERFTFTGNLELTCDSTLYNFFHALKNVKGEKFFEELKFRHKVEADLILQGKECLKN